MTAELIEAVPICLITPKPSNARRIVRQSVRLAIAKTVIENNGLPNEFALILRPIADGKFEAINGNTRLGICNALKDGIIPDWCKEVDANTKGFTGFASLPAFVKELSDYEAFFESIRANAQGELSPLEHGLAALEIPLSKGGRGNEGGLSRYASDIGESVKNLQRWRSAAKVIQGLELENRLEEFAAKISHLSLISTAVQRDWERLIRLVENGATIDSIRAAMSPVSSKIVELQSGYSTQPIEQTPTQLEPTQSQNDVTDQSVEVTEAEEIQAQMNALKSLAAEKINAEASGVKAIDVKVSGAGDRPAKSQASQALHSSASQESYTPLDVWDDFVAVFGDEVELDAATCEAAREATPTEKYFTKEDSGLDQDWICNNFVVNPPGGKEHQELVADPETGEIKLKQWGNSNQFLWFAKAESEYLSGNAKQGIYVAFNDALRAMCPSVHNYPICWVDASATAKCVKGGRLCFDKVDERGIRIPQNSPTHSNFFVFFPPKELTVEAIARFEEKFKKYGTVTVPSKWRQI